MDYEHKDIREEAPPVELIEEPAAEKKEAAGLPAEETAPVREPLSALTAVSAKKRAPRLEPQADSTASVPAAPPAAAPDPNERVPVCDVQFRAGSKIYFFDPAGLELKNGDHVILDTTRGAEYGCCVIGSHRIARRELVQPLRRVLRVATPVDERIKAENEKKEKDAYAFCQRKIEELGLDMQLVSVECAFDGSKLLFFFTADARVDFRELVKILAANYHTRIELRQIGVRDKAKMLGGLGICGRPFCCASFLDEFQPVSIKMAKTQNLSLNPTKISGTCGRLMCCLKYEQDAYEDLIRTSPKPDSFVDTPDGRGTVTGVNLMKQSVSVRMEQDEDEIHNYRNDEIFILRSGKAKKNDPPIPPDLAPISGCRDGALRVRRPFLDHRLTLDPGEEEFREPLSGETDEAAAEEADQENRPSRRGRRDRKPGQGEQRQEQDERSAQQSAASRRDEGRNAERKEGDRRDSTQPSDSARRENGKDGEQTAAHPEGGNRRGKKHRRKEKPEAHRGEKQEKPIQPEQKQDNKQPSRQQRRHPQKGKPEPKLPQPEPVKHSVPEKIAAEQPAPKPEGKKNNKRRYYHNRKPKG